MSSRKITDAQRITCFQFEVVTVVLGDRKDFVTTIGGDRPLEVKLRLM